MTVLHFLHVSNPKATYLMLTSQNSNQSAVSNFAYEDMHGYTEVIVTFVFDRQRIRMDVLANN